VFAAGLHDILGVSIRPTCRTRNTCCRV
jgi:hypothetical protein